ncbi:hypothetical protein [Burkholderia glumae]|uniref:hypothetical protein n=1 Tax=Burkholderia glumae TaxID=337 RepID=UPI003F49443D
MLRDDRDRGVAGTAGQVEHQRAAVGKIDAQALRVDRLDLAAFVEQRDAGAPVRAGLEAFWEREDFIAGGANAIVRAYTKRPAVSPSRQAGRCAAAGLGSPPKRGARAAAPRRRGFAPARLPAAARLP